MRSSFTVLLGLLLLATPVPSHATDNSFPDSLISGSTSDSAGVALPADSARTESPGAASLTVIMEGNRSVKATLIKPNPMGYVDVTTPDGRTEHIPINKIRAIFDERGVERTYDVLERNRTLGVGQPPHPTKWKSFRFRGGPKEVCGWFALTEFSYLWRWDAGSDVSHDEKNYVSFDLGAAKNLDRAMALGGTLFVGGDGQRSQFGARARVRFWISRAISFDLSPGLVISSDEEGTADFLSSGVISQAGLNAGDRVALVTQVFSTRRREQDTSTVTETAWYGGVKLGSGLGVTALLATSLAAIIAVAELSTL